MGPLTDCLMAAPNPSLWAANIWPVITSILVHFEQLHQLIVASDGITSLAQYLASVPSELTAGSAVGKMTQSRSRGKEENIAFSANPL